VGDSPVLEKAELLVQAKRYDDALGLLAVLPEDAGARYLGAVAYFCKEDLRRALTEVEKSIALSPEAPETHALRAEILHELGRKKTSLESAREAVRLAPDDAQFLYVLARAALGAREWKLAESAAQETVRLAPESADAHNIMALVAARRHRGKEAQEHLRQALRIDPNNTWVIHNLAVTMPRLKPRTETVKLLEEAARLDPSNKQVVDILYIEASQHVRGGGFDRLDILLGGPTLIFGVLTVSVLMGWVHLPRVLSITVVFVGVTLIVAYSVGDFLRNRVRLRKLGIGTRVIYFQRFYRDHWMAVVAFVLTLFVPAVILGALATSIGLPLVVTSGLIVASAVVWIGLAPLVWRAWLKPLLMRER
jgi:Tfp pilus assembly protein PilF